MLHTDGFIGKINDFPFWLPLNPPPKDPRGSSHRRPCFLCEIAAMRACYM